MRVYLDDYDQITIEHNGKVARAPYSSIARLKLASGIEVFAASAYWEGTFPVETPFLITAFANGKVA